jgi:tripeptide aminopeptidase
MELLSENIQALVQEKFLRYVKIWTTSEPDLASSKTPSTLCQWDLLRLLEQELKDMGVPHVSLNKLGYLIGTLPSNMDPGEGKDVPCLGFMAHVDTGSDAPG